jgi:hypothetical protein
VYYAVSNGQVLSVFDSFEAAGSYPLLSVRCDELPSRFSDLVALLSPQAMAATFPNRRLSSSPPLAPGLRSIARLSSGLFQYDRSSPPMRAVQQLRTFVVDGSLQRGQDGNLVAHIVTEAAVHAVHRSRCTYRVCLKSFRPKLSLNDSPRHRDSEPRVLGDAAGARKHDSGISCKRDRTLCQWAICRPVQRSSQNEWNGRSHDCQT